MEEQQQEMQQNLQMQQQMELTKQAGQMASAPMMDPSKNANADVAMNNVMGAEVAPPPEPPTQ